MASAAVIVLSHNDAAHVGEAVTSIVNQWGRARMTALVLADDASRDQTIDHARAAVADAVPLVVLQADHNLGQWENLNRAMRHAATLADWIFILHADDIAVDGWAEALLERAGVCGDDVASISTSWDMLYGDRIEHTGENAADEVRLIRGSREAVRDTLLSGCWWKISGAAVRAKAFAEVGDFDPRVPHAADWEWSLRALKNGWSFEYIPRVHTVYRQHEGTVSTSSFRDDVDIRDAVLVGERFRNALTGRERIRFYGSYTKHALRRMLRGMTRADGRRIATSLRTITFIGRHLAKQQPA
jgi:GT2 family glycosyltransferase